MGNTPRPTDLIFEVGGKKLVLTMKMRVFAEEYFTGEATGKRFNIRAAALHAGIAKNPNTCTPSVMGAKAMRHPAVQHYLGILFTEYSMSAQEVLARFSEVARSEVGDVVTKNHAGNLAIDANQVLANKRFIKQFAFDANGNPKIEFHDAMAALRETARILGMLKDGLEISGPGGGAVPVSMTVQFVRPDGTEVQTSSAAAESPTEDFSDIEEE